MTDRSRTEATWAELFEREARRWEGEGSAVLADYLALRPELFLGRAVAETGGPLTPGSLVERGREFGGAVARALRVLGDPPGATLDDRRAAVETTLSSLTLSELGAVVATMTRLVEAAGETVRLRAALYRVLLGVLDHARRRDPDGTAAAAAAIAVRLRGRGA